ncbi:MAG: substrate-binding domain-containing protein [Eubacteriaceae bacterium]|nr:substrate-binding domain-containing protein [Eubacteriaceae bacterium]
MKKSLTLLLAAIFLGAIIAGCASNPTTGTGGGGDNTGGNDITVISREDGSGTRGAFIELMGIQVKEGDVTKDMTTKEAIIADGTDIVLTSVANDANAIGYISTGSLNDTVKALQIEGAAPTIENIKNGAYPIARPFKIAYKGELEGVAADFVAFIFSKDGQDIVAKSCVTMQDTGPFESQRPEGKLVINGSSSVFPLMEKLVEAYLKINEVADIEVHMTDSSAGMAAAINGTCDIGMASRDLKESELEQLTDESIAIDGIAVIVNKENPATGMTKEEVRAIFTGEVSIWSVE